MPTKRPQFRFDPTLRSLNVAFTPAERATIDAICAKPEFAPRLLALKHRARWQHEASTLQQSPHECELALRRLHDELAAVQDLETPAQSRWLVEWWGSMSPTAKAFAMEAFARQGWWPRELAGLDRDSREMARMALNDAANAAAMAKSPKAQRGAREREAIAEELASLCREFGVPFYLNRADLGPTTARDLLRVIYPNQSDATLDRYLAAAGRRAKRPAG